MPALPHIQPRRRTLSRALVPALTRATGTAPMSPSAANPNTKGISGDPITLDECGAQNPAGLSDADAQKLKVGPVTLHFQIAQHRGLLRAGSSARLNHASNY